MGYCWEGLTTAIPQTSASDTVGQYNKKGDIIFKATFIYIEIL